MFVGDISGTIYDIDLISSRKSLALSGGLSDRVVDNTTEKNQLRLGTGFGLITDFVSRPDGLYVLNLDGDLYRIATLGVGGPPPATTPLAMSSAVPEPAGVALVGLISVLMSLRLPALRKRIEK
jgi:hypothetical protein